MDLPPGPFPDSHEPFVLIVVPFALPLPASVAATLVNNQLTKLKINPTTLMEITCQQLLQHSRQPGSRRPYRFSTRKAFCRDDDDDDDSGLAFMTFSGCTNETGPESTHVVIVRIYMQRRQEQGSVKRESQITVDQRAVLVDVTTA